MELMRDLWRFGLKQAYACMFGGYLLVLILLTKLWYPFTFIYRYDFLFIAALLFQVVLLIFKLERPMEAVVILVFHVVATALEIFKTSDSIRSWQYPEPFHIGIGNVPLFAGFMYSAVGSYIARVWRLFDFRFGPYPRQDVTLVLAAALYVNFFTHHFLPDCRWLLLLASIYLFFRTQVYYRLRRRHRKMSLLLGWLLVALFIWFAENIATFARIWVYPNQSAGWHLVPLHKLLAWYLLMMISFILVSLVHKPTLPDTK